jgi:hypothetical protein
MERTMWVLKLFILTFALILPKVAFSDLNYTALRVSETFDGRSKGDVFTGAWIKMIDVRQDGKTHILPILQFEIAGDYGGNVDTFGFTNGRTVTEIAPKFASRVDEWGGKKYYRVFTKNFKNLDMAKFLANLKPADQETIKAICGSLSDEDFVEGIIPKMISANRFGEKYNKYWSNKSRVTEIVSHAEECNRHLRQTNLSASKFVLNKKKDENISQLCGLTLNSALKFERNQKKAVQTTLKKFGHYEGIIDGDFGKNSCKALKKYFMSRSIPTTNNRSLKKEIALLIKGPTKNDARPTKVAPTALAVSEQSNVISNNKSSVVIEEKDNQDVGAVSNQLSIENSLLRGTIDQNEKVIKKLKVQLVNLTKMEKSAVQDTVGLKSLNAEQKKLTDALKGRVEALETASISMKTDLLKAEQTALNQVTKIDDLQAAISELKQNIASLEMQNKRLKTSELDAKTRIEKLGAEQAASREENNVLLTSNAALKVENTNLSVMLKQIGPKSLLEGGLSGKSSGFAHIKKDDADANTNSLSGNLISKKLIKDLKDENANFRQAELEGLEKIEAMKLQMQAVLNKLELAESSLDKFKKETTEQSIKITALQAALNTSKIETQSKVDELEALEAQLAVLRSFKAQVTAEKSQEIETSKIAVKSLFENKKALVLRSVSEEAEVKYYISNLIAELGLSPEADAFDVFLATDKTFSITLGLGAQDECNSMRDQLLTFDSIPEDSFCGDWNEYIAAFDFKNGQLFATVGKNYFKKKGSNSKVISTDEPNTLEVKNQETEQAAMEQPDAVKAIDKTVKPSESPIQNKASGTAVDIEVPPGTLDFYRKHYKEFIQQQTNDKFAFCRAIAVQLRADTLFFDGEYYENILVIFLQENAIEENRRGFFDDDLNGIQLKFKDQFEKTSPDLNQRTRLLSLLFFNECEGANIIPLQ